VGPCGVNLMPGAAALCKALVSTGGGVKLNPSGDIPILEGKSAGMGERVIPSKPVGVVGKGCAPVATVSAAVALKSGNAAVLSTTAVEMSTGAGVGVVDLNALAPWVTPLTAPAVTAPIAPAFRESLKFLPAIREVPAPATKPEVAAIKAGAAVLPNSIPAAAGPATMNRGRTDNDLTNRRIGKFLDRLANLLK
jgi:hypothetical protein